ncbi:MAG: hypothetical protein ING02_08890 [Roseomonas sp.]|nr:hypothetical protein [Roseomonas sp.]
MDDMVAYTDGSCKKSARQQRIGAGVYACSADGNVRCHTVDPGGKGITNTITRAELAAIRAALELGYRIIATDSLTSIFLIRRAVMDPNGLRHHLHKQMLESIVHCIAARQQQGLPPVHILKVRAHQGVVGNEMADAIARWSAEASGGHECAVQAENRPFHELTWLQREGDGPGQPPELLPDLGKSLRAHMASMWRLGSANLQSIYATSWKELCSPSHGVEGDPAQPADWAVARVLKAAWQAPFPHLRTLLRYRTGCLFNQKHALRFGWPGADGKCRLCGAEDSAGHMLLGPCTQQMQATVQARHNKAARLIASAVLRSDRAGDLKYADVARSEDEDEETPMPTRHSELLQWLVAQGWLPGMTRLPSRPDLVLDTPDALLLCELKYCSDTRWHEKRQAILSQDGQHAELLHNLRERAAAQGKTVELLPILLGAGASVYEHSTRRALHRLGVTGDTADRTLTKLSLLAAEAGHQLVCMRRAAEAADAGRPKPRVRVKR